jgi:hypothetical protein
MPRESSTHFASRGQRWRSRGHAGRWHWRSQWHNAAMMAAVLLVGGCDEPTSGVVTGVVAVDGAPAKEGAIAFFPTNGKSRTAGAEIIDGQYTAEVALGPSKVEIRVPKVVGEKKLYDTADSPIKKLMAESLPARYNDETELTIDIQPGENKRDFTLTTK